MDGEEGGENGEKYADGGGKQYGAPDAWFCCFLKQEDSEKADDEHQGYQHSGNFRVLRHSIPHLVLLLL